MVVGIDHDFLFMIYYSTMRIVIKVGTSSLTNGTNRISAPFLVELGRQVARLQADGQQVLLVTSGAIAAGREKLNFPHLPRNIPAKQMLSAAGQLRLMALYEQVFGLYDMIVGQVLLTRADLSDRRRYLNARNTLLAMLQHHVTAIINENDTVATEEIRVGDNDNLSALVANLVDADLLILLTDQDGLFTADPRSNPDAELVKTVSSDEIPEALWQAAGGSKSGLGTGGMSTKLQAADLARRSGTACVIANSSEKDVLLRLAAGEKIGTLFTPVVTAIESRKRYIMTARRAPGQISVDAGAAQALARGGSLLPVGMEAVHGKFERGDTVRILDEAGKEIARGIVNYGSGDLQHLKRQRSDEIENLLGYTYGDEVVHRSDLVLI